MANVYLRLGSLLVIAKNSGNTENIANVSNYKSYTYDQYCISEEIPIRHQIRTLEC